MSLVQVESIFVPRARYEDTVWTFDRAHVAELADDIRHSRLINPITLRPTTVKGYEFELGTGLHRLEAFRSLGRRKIEATIYYDMSDEEWEDHIISENLFRKESNDFYVRGQLLKRKMEIARALHPERFRPGPKSEELKAVKTPIEEAHEATGVAVTTLVEDLRIAEELEPELVKKLRDVGAYKKTILQIARAPEEKKHELLENFEQYAHSLSSKMVSEKQASKFAMERFVYRGAGAAGKDKANGGADEKERTIEVQNLLKPDEIAASVDSGWVARQSMPVLSGTGTRHLTLDLFYNDTTGRFMFVRTLRTSEPVTQAEIAGMRFVQEKLSDIEGFRNVHTLRREHDGTILLNESKAQDKSLRSFLTLASQSKTGYFPVSKK